MGHFSVEIMRLPGQLSVEINKLGISADHKYDSGDILGALRDFKTLCSKGDTRACENISVINENIGRGKFSKTKLAAGDVESALSDLRSWCAEGSAQACRGVTLIEQQREADAQAVASNNQTGSNSGEEAPPSSPSPPQLASPSRRIAANTPSVSIRANLGTGCINPELVNLVANTDPNAVGTYRGQWRITNKCNKDQIVSVESAGENGFKSSYMPAGLANIGAWRDYEYMRKLPLLPFAPVRRYEDGSSYLVGAGQYWFADDNRITSQSYSVWIASCDAYTAQGIKQAMYRSKSSLSDAPQIACAPVR